MNNKFKNITYAAAAVLIAAGLPSCSKQLNEVNPSNTTAEATWTTPQGYVAAVNAAYYDTHEWYGIEDGLLMSEGGTDLWFNATKANYANQLTRYEAFTPSSSGTEKNTWIYSWRGINQCNGAINHIDDAGFTDSTEKRKRLAEVRFLRAFYYYHIVETWGGVELRTAETNGADLTATRNKPEEFYDLMISDLLYAKDNLPLSWGTNVNSEYSRASKKSAAGLLARVYLSRAYYSTGGDAAAWFTKAKDAALDVINNKTIYGTDLWANYADLWDPKNNKVNKESLFTISYSLTNPTYNYSANANRKYKWFVAKYNGKPGLVTSLLYGMENEQRLMPTWHLLDLYNENIDARYGASFLENYLCNTAGYTWVKGDTATYFKASSVVGSKIDTNTLAMQITKGVVANKKTLPYVVFDRNDTYINPQPGQPANINTNTTLNNYFVALRKFADPNRTTPSTSPGYNDIFAIRFAEMYMIAAEAYFQLGDNANAALMINVLRTRAAKPGQVAAMQILPTDVTINLILDERAREFAGEQMRWFDLKRIFRGADFANYIKTYNPDISAVQDFHRLRPVPQTEMDALLNAAEFGQNPGY